MTDCVGVSHQPVTVHIKCKEKQVMYINSYLSPYIPNECPCGPVTQNCAEGRYSMHIASKECESGCGEHNSDKCHVTKVISRHANIRTNILHREEKCGEHHPDICETCMSVTGQTNIRTSELHRRRKCGSGCKEHSPNKYRIPEVIFRYIIIRTNEPH